MTEPFLLVCARGGSKGLPRKNVLPFAGKPLIAWTIAAAVKSGLASRVVVSTDDPEIARVAVEYGAQAPFMRPADLANDQAGALEVAEHALGWIADHEGLHPEWLILLQPTSPLRRAEDISQAFALAWDSKADAVIGVTKPAVHPYIARTLTGDGKLALLFPEAAGIKRRQDFPPAWIVNGAIYIVRTEVLLQERTFQPKNTLPYFMAKDRSVDIDDAFDLGFAEYLLNHASA